MRYIGTQWEKNAELIALENLFHYLNQHQVKHILTSLPIGMFQLGLKIKVQDAKPKNSWVLNQTNTSRVHSTYPGMPEHFSNTQQPVLSIIADLSSINLPGQSGLKWHGNKF